MSGAGSASSAPENDWKKDLPVKGSLFYGLLWQQMTDPEGTGWMLWGWGPAGSSRGIEIVVNWTSWMWTLGLTFSKTQGDDLSWWTWKGRRRAEGYTDLSLCLLPLSVTVRYQWTRYDDAYMERVA